MQTPNTESTQKGKRSISLGKSRFRHGGFAVILTVFVIAAVIGVNFLAKELENRFALTIDASPNKITNFSAATYSLLDSIDQPVHLYFLFEEGNNSTLRINLEEIARKFHARNQNIILGTIDPVKEPNRVAQYAKEGAALQDGSIIAANGNASRVKVIPANEMYTVRYDQNYNPIITGFNGEAKLVSALMYASSDVTPMVYFLAGHNEVPVDQMAMLREQLGDQNFDTAELKIMPGTKLERGNVLVIAQPSLDLSADEYTQVRDWLEDGGRMFFAAGPEVDFARLPNFTKLLSYYALSFKDGIVVEDNAAASNWALQQGVLVPNVNKESTHVREISEVGQMMLPGSRAIQKPAMPLSGVVYEPLLTTSSGAFIKKTGSAGDMLTRTFGDEVGQQTIAMALLNQADVKDASKDTRIVMLGNLFPVVDNDTMTRSYNLVFTMAAMEWLVNRQNDVYVPSKPLSDTTLAIPNAATLWVLAGITVILVPLLVAISGVLVWLRRRRL